MTKLLRNKKAREHRKAVKVWRKPFQKHNLVYRKIASHYYWIPGRRK